MCDIKIISRLIFAMLTSIMCSCCFYEFVDGSSKPDNREFIGREYLTADDAYIYGIQASGKEKNILSHYEIRPYRVGGWEYRTEDVLHAGTRIKIVKMLDTTNFQFFTKRKKAVVSIENAEKIYKLEIRVWMDHLEKMGNANR